MNPKQKIAIDIVLLLSDNVNKILFDLSSKIISPRDFPQYKVDGRKYIPHVSLLMGTASTQDIHLIKNKIEVIAKKYLPLKITFSQVELAKFPGLKIEKSEELVKLQQEVAQTVKLDYDADKTMFFDKEISDLGVEWVNRFKENNLGEGKFNLHVTLGQGDASKLAVDLPFEVTASTLAIGHLGYGCSCRKIL